MRNKNENKSSWLPRVIVILGLVLLGLIIFAVVKETYKKKQVQAEIDQLKEEAERIDKKNAELADKISYFESSDYKEKEAKDKLNLQDPGENVVVVKPNSSVQSETRENKDTASADEKKLIVRVSNIQKWWNYFFK